MKKWVITISILIVSITIAVVWFGLIIISGFKSTFGTTITNINIELENNNTLICEERYSADLADVFYEINFTLRTNNSEIFELGNGLYHTKNWSENIALHELDNWYILETEYDLVSKLLLTNKNTNLSLEHLFSPLELKNDSIWKLANMNYQVENESEIDSIIQNNIFVENKYRVEKTEPVVFITQLIEYEFNTDSAYFQTKTIFPAREK